MKKIIATIVCLLFLTGLSMGIYLWQHQQHLTYPNVTQAEIYVDPASYPTLLQMIHLIKNDSKNPKFIFWPRSKNLDISLPIFDNSQLLRHFSLEGTSSVSREEEIQFLNKFRKKLTKFLRRYPNAKFAVHLNAYHNNFIWAVLSLLPPERVERLYFYEDSFASTLFQNIPFDKVSSPELTKFLLEADVPPEQEKNSFFLSVTPLYNTTLYLGIPEKTVKFHPNLAALKQQAQIVNVEDMRKVRNKLTAAQKKLLLRSVGLDDVVLKPFHQDKPVFLYILGTTWQDPQPLNNLQLRALEDFMSGKFGQFGRMGEDYILLLKEHPRITDDQSLKKTILKKYPQAKFLPKTFPVELLFFTDHMPDKVFGYSSSLFFALPPERILFYIQRPSDPYVPLLKQMGILTDDKIISLGEE